MRRFLTCRLRRDHPEMENGKPRDKYLSAFGDTKHLFFPPGAGELLADTSVPIIIVEAEKSVLAIMAAAERTGRRVLAIGTGGCWGWRGRIGKTTDSTGTRVDETGPLPDLGRVTWTGRDAVNLFDSNSVTNEKVQAARVTGRELLTQQTIDRAALEKLRADQIAIHDAASRRLIQAIADAAEALTPEQRRKMAAMLPPPGGAAGWGRAPWGGWGGFWRN